MTHLKLNAHKASLALFNTVLSIAFFFSLRRSLMRLIGFKVGRRTTVHRNVLFFAFGKCVIGHNCTLNYRCYVDNRGGITIGNNVNISHDTKIYTMGHDIDHPMSPTVIRPVCIHDNVWIFPNTLIMPGVNIGEGAVIYPGSVVTRNVEAYSIVGGNPARHIRYRNKDIAYTLNFPIWFSI